MEAKVKHTQGKKGKMNHFSARTEEERELAELDRRKARKQNEQRWDRMCQAIVLFVNTSMKTCTKCMKGELV